MYFDWFFRHPWGGLVLLVLIGAAILYAFIMYHREKGMSLVKRVCLATLRAMLLSLVVVLLFEPVLGFEMQVKARKNLLVLVDTSQSMGIKDARRSPKEIEQAAQALGRLDFGKDAMSLSDRDRSEAASASRFDLAKGILDSPRFAGKTLLNQMSDDYQVRTFSFADRLGETSPDLLKKIDSPAGKSTRLGDAIEEAVSLSGGQAISGIVVLTDGGSNQGVEPLDVAKRMKDQDIPLFTIGLGLPNPPDVRLKNLVVPDRVFVKDIVPIRFQVSSTGLINQTVNVSLQLDGKEIARKPVLLGRGGQFIEMYFTPEKVSDAANLSVVAAPAAGEVNLENNRLTKTVKIIDDKIKVLYVEGKPRWEFRYLRRVLQRDHRLDVKLLMTEGDKELPQQSPDYIGWFPEDAAGAFNFDLVILGDVPATYFTGNQLTRMEQMVRQWGGSLIMIGGSKYAPMSYANTPVAQMLPVILQDPSPQTVDDGVFPVVTSAGYESAMMSLEPEREATAPIWSLVHPMFTLPSLAGAKPGATVLAELSDSRSRREAYPLIAWQRYGTGKTLFVATDQLWRMRLKVGDKYHARFWGQAIQFLTLSKLLGQNKRIQLETDKVDAQVGQRIQINANVLNEAYDPANLASYSVQLQQVDEKGQSVGAATAVKLEPATGFPGLYQGFVSPEQPGRYRLTAPTADQPQANTVEFALAESSLESIEPAMQEDLLRKMAELSGGQYVSISELPALKQAIGVGLEPTFVRRERELWDLPVVLVLLLTLLGAEWFFRRKYDLL